MIGILIVGGAALATPKSWYSRNALDQKEGIGRYAGVLTSAGRAKVDQMIPRLEQFVAHDRGGPFPSGVTVQYLGDREFKNRVEHSDLDTPAGIPAVQAALGVQLTARQTAAHLKHRSRSDIAGLYLPPHTVLMRGNSLDIEHIDILVHELTHAWDGPELAAHDPRARPISPDHDNAVDALVEGDATAVEADYLDSIGPEQGCQVMEELALPFTAACKRLHYTDGLASINPGDIDAAAEAYGFFPYTAGVLFVRALRHHGGETEVDHAFAHPPIDTAQVIEPSLYLRGVTPRHVVAPQVAHPAGRPASLGELGVSVVLTDGALQLNRKGYLSGWAGDTYVENQRGGQRCLHDDLLLRSPSYAATAWRRFRIWSKDQPGRSAQRLGPDSVSFTTCH